MKVRSGRGSVAWVPLTLWLRTLAMASAMAGCSGSIAARALRAAERGDESALREAIAAGERAGTLSNGDAAALAHAVADREIRSASGDVAGIRDAAPCAGELDDALAARMRTHDAAGAEAALARVASGGLTADAGRPFATEADAGWRAFGVRALTRGDDADARRHALLDPAPAVRRQAARAEGDAARTTSPGGLLAALATLAEAARVDPEPIVRTEAVRAIGALPSTPNGEAAVALRDLWASADDGLREDLALAWSRPRVWDAGGSEALRFLVASEPSPGAIDGAAAALGHRDAEPGLAEAAVGQIARAIEAGPRALRLQALREAPLERGNLLAIVQKAADDDDPEVRVGALGRLVQATAGKDRDRAVAALEALAQPTSEVAERARSALAAAHDRRVQAWIEEDLVAPGPEKRLAAASALAALGLAARAAPLLVDAERRVRIRAACTILLGTRGRAAARTDGPTSISP